jgi:TolB-like protein
VNLAARLAALAGPSQIVVSAEVRDTLAPGFDPEIEDMGECFVKHLAQPVRAWRMVGPPSEPPKVLAAGAAPELSCSIAVLPFSAVGGDTTVAAGTVLADDVVEGLMTGRHWRVVSRLSAAAAAARGMTVPELGRHLRARWIIDGRLLGRGDRVEASVSLVDTEDDRVVDVQRFAARRGDFEAGEGALGREIAEWAARRVTDSECALAASRPLPTVQSHALLLSATQWMHRMARDESRRADDALEHLMERHPRSAEPKVWMAKAQLICLAQGWSGDPSRVAARARDLLARALDLQPRHALALALEGQITAYAAGDLDSAERCFERAIETNPNEPLTWLFRSNLLANRGNGDEALAAAEIARALSPLDPLAFMYDIYAAYAALIGGDAPRAKALARRSVRANRLHFPSHPVLICCEMAAGDIDAARASARAYLEIRPHSSVSSFAAAHRASAPIVNTLSAYLREAGMPA